MLAASLEATMPMMVQVHTQCALSYFRHEQAGGYIA